jgi:MarR family transcriptional regulator for hemolysin
MLFFRIALRGRRAMDYVKDLTLLPFERAFKVITQRADALLLKTLGCNRREMWILLCIDDNLLSQRQIGEILGLHPNVLVKLLDGMEQRTLLKRARRQSDRREQVIRITDKGAAAMQSYLTEKPSALLQIFNPLTDDQIEQWRALSLAVLQGVPIPTLDDDSDG